MRRAAMLNVLLAGAGQCYLGQTRLGLTLMAGFLLPFLAAVSLALTGLIQTYAIASGEIMAPGQLERLETVFHLPWLLTLAGVAVATFVTSMILLWVRPPGR